MGIDATSAGGSDDAPHEGFKVPDATTIPGTLAATPTTVAPGGRVDFDASSFLSGSAQPKGFAWDFDGDGRSDATTEAPRASHVYPTPGHYVARVRVADTRLGSGIGTAEITVTEPPSGPPGPSGPPSGPGGAASARLSVARRGRRGRYTLRVTCTPSCVVRVQPRLTRASARALGSGRRLRAVSRTVRGTARLRVRVGRRVLRRARARGVRVLHVRVRATAAPPGGARVSRTRTVRVRR
jgi:hypothetical protein